MGHATYSRHTVTYVQHLQVYSKHTHAHARTHAQSAKIECVAISRKCTLRFSAAAALCLVLSAARQIVKHLANKSALNISLGRIQRSHIANGSGQLTSVRDNNTSALGWAGLRALIADAAGGGFRALNYWNHNICLAVHEMLKRMDRKEGYYKIKHEHRRAIRQVHACFNMFKA